MEQRRALGRGIAALISKTSTARPVAVVKEAEPAKQAPQSEDSPFREVAISQIHPCAEQPRKNFNEDRIEELANSIKQQGILHPLLVRTVPGGYELISGERRWRAAKKIGLEMVPVLVRDVARQEQLELALIENLQRADLDPIEEAQGFAELMDKFSITQEEIAEHVGRSRSAVANSLRLLKLPEKAHEALRSGALTVGHAKILLGESMDTQLLLLDKVLKEDLAVRQLERLAKALGNRKSRVMSVSSASEKPKKSGGSTALSRIMEELRKRLGTQVQIETTAKGGKIIIDYYSDEQLDDLYQRITGYHLTRKKTRGI